MTDFIFFGLLWWEFSLCINGVRAERHWVSRLSGVEYLSFSDGFGSD
ncbi:MAG: hypothetical protein KAU21_15035 [Gammaproteobacteria bacterium]|nr:hypothetical protein [Gammaproteobacteria bacterium]